MIPRYRAWDKTCKTMYEADDIMYIDFEEKEICVKTLFRDVKGCDRKKANKTQNALNLCYAEKAALTPLKAVQMEGMLSRELFSEIVDFVFNNYEWSERLDSEIDRIILKYRTRGKVGRNKITVRKALYKAYALGV